MTRGSQSRPWRVIEHRVGKDGLVVEHSAAYSTAQRAFEVFKVVVLFDKTAWLEYRGD